MRGLSPDPETVGALAAGVLVAVYLGLALYVVLAVVLPFLTR
jgi:hypothetical protein